MGCGTGRHSVELARPGYRVTGVDISQVMLREAALAAERAGVHVEFVRQDARELKLSRQSCLTPVSACVRQAGSPMRWPTGQMSASRMR